MDKEKTTLLPRCITHPRAKTISRQFQFKFKLPTCPFFMKQIESQSTGLEKRSQIRPNTQMVHSEWQPSSATAASNLYFVQKIDVIEKASALL